jgi:hypothetical protein
MLEQWKSIFSGRYAVSDQGRVMRVDRASGTQKGRILKPMENDDGYLFVGLALEQGGVQQHYRVHRLVADAFLAPDAERPQINHKNGHRKDNRAANLERCTNRENALHASGQGWLKHGSEHAATHLTEAKVLEIRHRFAAGEKIADLASEFSITLGTISPLIRGRTWRHVPDAIIRAEHSRATLTAADVLTIRRRHHTGASQAALCREYNVTPGTMSALISGKTWKHID